MFYAKTHSYLDLYAIFWHVTRAYPARTDGAGRELMGSRPDTFAALGSINDIEAATLKKDSRYAHPSQHLFFSRQWSAEQAARMQTTTLSFRYPLTAIEPQEFDFDSEGKFTTLRFSLAVMDTAVGKLGQTGPPSTAYARHRTDEELEAELSAIFETTVREVLRWGVYPSGDGRMIWSPTPVAGQRMAFPMAHALAKGDSIKGRYYRDFGIDQVSGVQGYCTFRMPRLICYTPLTGAGTAPDAGFTYPDFIPSPRLPDGQSPTEV